MIDQAVSFMGAGDSPIVTVLLEQYIAGTPNEDDWRRFHALTSGTLRALWRDIALNMKTSPAIESDISDQQWRRMMILEFELALRGERPFDCALDQPWPRA